MRKVGLKLLQQSFLKLFGNNKYEINDDGALIFKPLNKEILPTKEKDEKLKELYDDDKIGVGTGIHSFYNKVADKYVGIGQGKVERFLKDQFFCLCDLGKDKNSSILISF